MKVRDTFLENGRFIVNDGKEIRFWEDKWLGNFTLKQRFPALYNIVRRKNDVVANVCRTIPLNVLFRRGLHGINLQKWRELVDMIVSVSLNDSRDTFKWNLHQNGLFTVHSMYALLISNGQIRQDQIGWRLKLPLKIKIFSWYLRRGVILTKDNLAKRNWNGNKKCVFCSREETIQHLFFDCHVAKFIWRVVSLTFGLGVPTSIMDLYSLWLLNVSARTRSKILVGATAICWAIWLTRNDVVFDKSPIKSYMQVLFRGTYWCRFWALLQKREEDANEMKAACRMLETSVMQIFAQYGWQFSNRITF
jgi:hypothetical protein